MAAKKVRAAPFSTLSTTKAIGACCQRATSANAAKLCGRHQAAGRGAHEDDVRQPENWLAQQYEAGGTDEVLLHSLNGTAGWRPACLSTLKIRDIPITTAA